MLNSNNDNRKLQNVETKCNKLNIETNNFLLTA